MGDQKSGTILRGYFASGMPQLLLTPEANPGYERLRDAYAKAAEEIRQAVREEGADLLLLYSTQWPSVIGHQIQARGLAEWVHVDPEWHELGEIAYALRFDADFGEQWQRCATARGLHARTVDYHGFPIDTGAIVALKLLDPDGALPASLVSSNMYSDRAETVVLGKSARDAVERSGKRAIVIAVSNLSNRMFTEPVAPAEDRISSLKDDEWNRKILEFFGEGRLEDVSQLARQFFAQANADQKFKASWWMAATMGQHNNYAGEVMGYEAVMGAGASLVRLVPSSGGAVDKEFDEADPETFGGDRSVLDAGGKEPPATAAAAPTRTATPGVVNTDAAPKPVGAYPHARRIGDLLYLSGVGPRQPGTGDIPGGPVRDDDGARDYDVEAQTRATIENVKAILEAAGSSLDRVVDVTAFLIDMDRDFADYNRVYAEYFEGIQATRTTLAIRALPTPIAVELKVIARA